VPGQRTIFHYGDLPICFLVAREYNFELQPNCDFSFSKLGLEKASGLGEMISTFENFTQKNEMSFSH
jgi:hypothetical protein